MTHSINPNPYNVDHTVIKDMATATEHTSDEKLRLGDPNSSLVSFEPVELPSSNQRVLGFPHPKDTDFGDE